jgi:sporulation protein YlmC with PRC-barrel domain
MDVLRDVLDKLVVDRNGRVMGRVDGILLEEDAGRPARLAYILIGPAALGDRLHPAVGRFVRRVETWFGLDANRPARIAFTDIEEIGTTIHLRLAIGDTSVGAVEQRLRTWVQQLPGGR